MDRDARPLNSVRGQEKAPGGVSQDRTCWQRATFAKVLDVLGGSAGLRSRSMARSEPKSVYPPLIYAEAAMAAAHAAFGVEWSGGLGSV